MSLNGSGVVLLNYGEDVQGEEIKKLRTELLQENESMNKNKSVSCHQKTQKGVRNLETLELRRRRATGVGRVAGATKDATPGDIVSWNVEADRCGR